MFDVAGKDGRILDSREFRVLSAVDEEDSVDGVESGGAGFVYGGFQVVDSLDLG